MKRLYIILIGLLTLCVGTKAQDYVKIDGQQKAVHSIEVMPVYGDDNSFSVRFYLSKDKNNYVAVMGNNELHAIGKYIDLSKYEDTHSGKTYWAVRYYKDGNRVFDAIGDPSFASGLFTSGKLRVTGKNPRNGRYGVTLTNGQITDTKRGDGETHTIEIVYRSEWTEPTAGALNIGTVKQNSIALSWEKSTDNDTPQDELEYVVYYKSLDSSGLYYREVGNDTSYVINNLNPGTTYKVSVQVRDAAGNFTDYEEKEVTTLAKPYSISITNGRSFVNIKGKRVYVKEATPGTTITISTVAPGANMEFSNWEVVSRNTSLTDIYAKITTFTMPASAVDIKAVYVKKDVREEVTSVSATSDIADIIEYGNEKKKPTITLSEGSVAKLSQSSIGWQKKDAAGEWQSFEESTFTEGVYRVLANVSVDGSYGTTHKLADDWTMIVDGKEWTTERPIVNDTYSSAWITSPEIVVEKDEDTREKVKSVTATSDIADIIGYGKERKTPIVTVSEGSVVRIPRLNIHWLKKNASGEWQRFEESTFTEGTYRVGVHVRVDGSYGTTHRLADKWTLTVDGKEWETGKSSVYNTFSYAGATSPDIIVENPVGIESAKSTGDSPANIYNLQGILVKRNATADDFHSLPAGIYIMNGRKVIVK